MSLAVMGHGLQPAQSETVIDGDRDGISDALEQALLDRFAPTFFVSASECDTLPASFKANAADPLVSAREGRIYGQASPSALKALPAAVELHYYHLWSRDCGRMGHKLDAEHVSVLVTAPAPDSAASAWKAEYWYAAAHEDTVCEASRWTTAAALNAAESGAKVWISSGKHASYFSEDLCRGGCGGDRCDRPKEIPRLTVINLGERNAPMNGALWTASRQWQLSQKMTSDFPEATLAELKKASWVGTKHTDSVQAIVLGGGSAMGGLAIGREQTVGGVNTGTKHTGRALGTAYRSVKKGFAWAFTGRKPKAPTEAGTPPPANPRSQKREGDSQ